MWNFYINLIKSVISLCWWTFSFFLVRGYTFCLPPFCLFRLPRFSLSSCCLLSTSSFFCGLPTSCFPCIKTSDTYSPIWHNGLRSYNKRVRKRRNERDIFPLVRVEKEEAKEKGSRNISENGYRTILRSSTLGDRIPYPSEGLGPCFGVGGSPEPCTPWTPDPKQDSPRQMMVFHKWQQSNGCLIPVWGDRLGGTARE